MPPGPDRSWKRSVSAGRSTSVAVFVTASSVSSFITRFVGTVSTGASLTAVTVIEAVSLATLYAVVPPRPAAFCLVATLPEVWSHAK